MSNGPASELVGFLFLFYYWFEVVVLVFSTTIIKMFEVAQDVQKLLLYYTDAHIWTHPQ